MKKYMIPICMAAGALIGILIGVILKFAVQIFICAGAAFGIVVGVILQLVWNQTLPDSYFAKKKRKTDMDASLFAEDKVAQREEKTVGHTFHEKNVEEEDEETDFVPEKLDPAAQAERAEQARRAAQRKEWEALRAKRQQAGGGAPKANPGAAQQRAATQRSTTQQPKRRVIVEEDED